VDIAWYYVKATSSIRSLLELTGQRCRGAEKNSLAYHYSYHPIWEDMWFYRITV
jgi:hypothetical protein